MARAYAEVPLHGKKAAGRMALVDLEDYERVSKYRWNVWEIVRDGKRNSGPYAVAWINRHQVRMHKLLTGYAQTDHENTNGLDNRRHNLRDTSAMHNQQNRRVRLSSASGFKGVTIDKRPRKRLKPWVAYITVCGKRRTIGSFVTAELAARAYDRAALRAFGEHARLNFP